MRVVTFGDAWQPLGSPAIRTLSASAVSPLSEERLHGKRTSGRNMARGSNCRQLPTARLSLRLYLRATSPMTPATACSRPLSVPEGDFSGDGAKMMLNGQHEAISEATWILG
jgi:hypothetical protein